MNIQQDGHICLHCVDLEGWDVKDIEGSSKRLATVENASDIDNFSVEAQIAVAYARMAGYRATFVSSNTGIVKITTTSTYDWSEKEWRKWKRKQQ